MCQHLLYTVHMASGRHPNKVIQAALVYARQHAWIVTKSTGGSAHAGGSCAVSAAVRRFRSSPRREYPRTTPGRCGGRSTDAHTRRRTNDDG
jgi:hypothetical protein